MIAQSTTHGSGVVVLLWAVALAGWLTVTVSLRRGLTGAARDAAVTAHVLTLVLIMLRGTVLGHGLLLMVIPAGAAWWALLLVTGLRAERLLDPPAGALGRLGCWLAVGCGVAAAGYLLVLRS